MAEYFPLLDRAVSGLTETTPEARRSIYERARTALIGQLRRMEPPVPEEDIARESTALDEAIARVEARFADLPAPETPAAPIRVPPRPAPVPAPPPAAPAPAPASPPVLPNGAAPPVVPPPSRERSPIGQRTAPSVDGSAVPVTSPSATEPPTPSRRMPPRAAPGGPGPARPTLPPRGTRPVMALRPVADGASRPPPGTPATDAAPRDDGGLPPAGRLAGDPPSPTPDIAEAATDAAARRDGSGFAAALDAAGRADGRDGDRPSGPALGPRIRDAALRPPAPRPRQDRRFGWPGAIAAVVAVALMVGIGVAAYRMRDRPDQVVAAHAETAPEAVGPGKMAARAGSATSDAAGTGSDPTSGATDAAPVAQTGSDAGAATPSIAVAQRAALLVDAPEDAQRVKTYVGTVVWHLDSVSPGQGQPLATAMKADVDIPDAKLKVTMLMQKNPEPQLPASHTIEFHFLPQPDNALGSVKQVNVPEMRKDDDAATGDPLAGVPVAITDNYFLVGLSRGAAEGQNIRLMTERNWFDMSLLFVSGKLGKLTFEKGAAGQRTFEDALKAWK